MGNIGSLFRRMSRPVRGYNLDARVEKVLTRVKPLPAPRHPGTELVHSPESAEMMKELLESDSKLLKRLEQVYVTSQDSEESEKMTSESSRPLPVQRGYPGESNYGYYEPKSVPYGKATLKTVLEFMSYHNEMPEDWNSQRISEEYKLDKNRIDNVLHYFDTYTLFMPPTKSKKPVSYDVNQTKILGAHKVIQITAADEEDKAVKST